MPIPGNHDQAGAADTHKAFLEVLLIFDKYNLSADEAMFVLNILADEIMKDYEKSQSLK